MAATVSSVWAKPGAWALDAEEHEDELKHEIESPAAKAAYPEPPSADFPTLAAAATKTKKKNKGQTLSLSEFTTQYGGVKAPAARPEKLTTDELLSLPTAPRQRSAEELEQSRLGGGFRNYGSYGADRSSSRVSERGNSARERVDLGQSRADEVDDWSKTKKFTGGASAGSFGGGERREKVGFFAGASRADEVDNWGSTKSFSPIPNFMDGGRRERRMGFDSFANGGGVDSDNWTRRRDSSSDMRRFDRGFDRESKVVAFESSGAADSDNWLKKEGREIGSAGGNGARPRLNLQPRTLPINNVNGSLGVSNVKPRGSNPFGEARPREVVLKVKGKDWMEIDEKLEAAKMEEGSRDGQGFRRKGFGLGRVDSSRDDLTEKSWRKAEAENAQPVSTDKAGSGRNEKAEDVDAEKPENGDAEDTE